MRQVARVTTATAMPRTMCTCPLYYVALDDVSSCMGNVHSTHGQPNAALLHVAQMRDIHKFTRTS